MDIKDLTKILMHCYEDNSIDELLKTVGVDYDGMKKGDAVKINMVFNKKDDGKMDVELSKEDVSKDEIKLDELDNQRFELEDKYDTMLGEEPEDKDSEEHEEWEEKIDELETLIGEIDDQINELEEKLEKNKDE